MSLVMHGCKLKSAQTDAITPIPLKWVRDDRKWAIPGTHFILSKNITNPGQTFKPINPILYHGQERKDADAPFNSGSHDVF
jgi:hypothetical protein